MDQEKHTLARDLQERINSVSVKKQRFLHFAWADCSPCFSRKFVRRTSVVINSVFTFACLDVIF